MSTASQVYTWEPSNAAIAARYGLRPEDVLRFDTNTSPVAPGLLPSWLAQPIEPPVNEYPDSSYADLTRAAAAYAGVPPEQIVVGAGADEVLDLVGKAFLPAGSAALVPIPTYAMYGVLTTQRAARIVAVPRMSGEHGFALDVGAMVAQLAEAAVVWLCSPNNPTGALDSAEDLEAILHAAAESPARPIVVIDEAYHEFAAPSAVRWLSSYPNLLVVRTLSKAFGLAGVRAGYGIGGRSVIERLERVRPPGSISSISAHIGARALRAPEYAVENARALSAERGWLAQTLGGLGWAAWPSVCNFVLVRIGDNAAAESAAEGMLRAGIVPRTFGPANPLRGHLRLTVRSREENQRLVEAVEGLR